MIGIDLSPDMLDCAKKKSEGRDILYLNQDMSNFELYGTVDAIVCLMDSINYLLYVKDVKRLVKLVKNYLNPEGFLYLILIHLTSSEIFLKITCFTISPMKLPMYGKTVLTAKEICEFDITFLSRKASITRSMMRFIMRDAMR